VLGGRWIASQIVQFLRIAAAKEVDPPGDNDVCGRTDGEKA
jgi:hypothetical protein